MNIVTSNIGSKILRIIQNNKKLGLLSALVVLDAALLSVNSRSGEGLIGQSASLPNYHEAEQQIAACPKNIAKNLAKKSSPGAKPTVGAPSPARPVSVKAAPAKPQAPVAQTPHFKKSHQIFSPNFTQSSQQVNKLEERRRPLESRYLQGAAKQAAAAKEKKALEQEVSKQEEEASKLWEEKQSYARRAVNAINFSVRKQIEEQQKTISNPGNDQTLPGKKDPHTSGEPVIQTVQDCSQDQEEEKKVLERLNKRSLTCQDLKEVGYTVNFEDISILELLQFVSKISGTNFVFDSNDLQFNVTIVSHDPTSVDDLATI
ncbi:Type III secretion structural protein [Chlamydia trachomatis]|nr:Type III secretion structural protein [Chlamydia trachomatis]